MMRTRLLMMHFWLTLAVFAVPLPGYSAPTSSGPTSEAEAQLLWKEGQTAVQESRYQDAENYLQRFVDRYPGTPGSLQAKLLLGRTWAALGKNKEATQALIDYLSSTGIHSDSIKARIELGQIYLKLKKYSEARLLTLENERALSQFKTSKDLMLENLLLKVKALLKLNQTVNATNTLDVVQKCFGKETNPKIRGETYVLQLEAQAAKCAHLSPKNICLKNHKARLGMTESQVRNLAERQGNCLLEALLLFHKTLGTGDSESAEQAANQVNQAFGDYHQACSQPPLPPPTSLHNKQQIKKTQSYQIELADILTQDCNKKLSEALDLLSTWKTNLPAATVSMANKVSQNLNKLISREL